MGTVNQSSAASLESKNVFKYMFVFLTYLCPL